MDSVQAAGVVRRPSPAQLLPGTQAGGGGHLGRSSFEEGAWGSDPRVQMYRALGLGAWGDVEGGWRFSLV